MAERRLFGVSLKRTVMQRMILNVWADSPKQAEVKAESAVRDIERFAVAGWVVPDEAAADAAIIVEGVIPED